MKTSTLFFDKKIIITAVVYFSISIVLLFNYGIQLGGEAEKVIANANLIINGQALFNGAFGYLYIAYYLLVALFIKLSVNLFFIAVFQIALSFIAALCLYKFLKQVLENQQVAFLFFCCLPALLPYSKMEFLFIHRKCAYQFIGYWYLPVQ